MSYLTLPSFHGLDIDYLIKIPIHLEPQNVTLFGDDVFVDVMHLWSWDENILDKGGPYNQWACPYKKKRRHRETHTGKKAMWK